jgi:hypothetical protein
MQHPRGPGRANVGSSRAYRGRRRAKRRTRGGTIRLGRSRSVRGEQPRRIV